MVFWRAYDKCNDSFAITTTIGQTNERLQSEWLKVQQQQRQYDNNALQLW